MKRSRGRVLAGLLAAALASGVFLVVNLAGADTKKATAPTRLAVADIRPPTRVPNLSEAAGQPTVAGATAFTLFWFDTLNYSLAHGDTDLLAHWSGAGCNLCSGWLLGISRWKADGSKLEGGLTYPLGLAIGPFSTTEPVSLAATFSTSPAAITAKDGTVQRYPGGSTRGGVTVLWTNGRWQMTNVILDVNQPGATP